MSARVTQFTPSATCATIRGGTLTSEAGFAIRQGVQCKPESGLLNWDNNCFPTPAPPLSAGCPYGWVSAATFDRSAVGCCPVSYNYAGSAGGDYSCASLLTALTTIIMPDCVLNVLNPTPSPRVFSSGSRVFAKMVFLTAEATASSSSSSSSPRSSSSAAPSSTFFSSTTIPTSSSISSSVPQADPGLSNGAIAGIAIGVASAIALLGAVVFLLLRRRKKAASASPASDRAMIQSSYKDTQPAVDGGYPAVGIGHEAGYGAAVPDESGGFKTSPWSPPPVLASDGTHTPELASSIRDVQGYNNHPGGETDSFIENTGPHYPKAYASSIPLQEARASRLAELDQAHRELEQRMARARYLSAMEDEYARIQAEMARLRNG